MAPTKAEIETRVDLNISRVLSLIGVYDAFPRPGPGRPPVHEADVLRAGVVLLHAALEDLLRSLEEMRLPTAAPEAFKGFRLAPSAGSRGTGKESFTLVDLAGHRGQTVGDVFALAIDFHLERSNYNHPGEVKDALARVNVSFSTVQHGTWADLASMMSRRHLIAHRADRNPLSGRGHHAVQPIGRDLVRTWRLPV